MTTLTIKNPKDGKNQVKIFRNIEQLKKVVIGSRKENKVLFLILLEKHGKKDVRVEYEFVAVGYDQHDESIEYLKRLKILDRDNQLTF